MASDVGVGEVTGGEKSRKRKMVFTNFLFYPSF
jgi:hypothetical protein